MAVQPYKVNKSRPIDFILAGVRGTLAGALGVKEAQKQAKQLEFENQMKLDDYQLRLDALEQQRVLATEDHKARMDEIMMSGKLDLARAQTLKEMENIQSNKEMVFALGNALLTHGMQLQYQLNKDDVDNMMNNLKYQLDKKQVDIQQQNANTNADRVQLSNEIAGAKLDIASQNLDLRAQQLETQRQNDVIGRKIHVYNATKEKSQTIQNEVTYRTALSIADRDAKTASTEANKENKMKASQSSILAGKFGYDRLGVDQIVHVYVERKMGTDKVADIPYSQYLDVIATGKMPDGTTLNDRELSQIKVGGNLTPEIQSKTNIDLGKDEEYRQSQVDLKSIKDDIDKLSSTGQSTTVPLIPKKAETTTKTLPVVLYPSKPVPTTAKTFSDFVQRVNSFSSAKQAYNYLTKNKKLINSEYNMANTLDQLIADVKALADKE